MHVATLARALRSRGVDVCVLDIGRGDHVGPGVTQARGRVRFTAQLARVTWERRIVHVHTSGANLKSWLVALASSRARWPGGPRPLLTIHSGLAPDYLDARRRRRRMAKKICSRFGHVLAASPGVAGALGRAGVPRALVSVEPAFLAAQVAPGEPPRPLQVFRAAHAPIFCAALAPTATYGEDLLVEAFQAVRQRLPRAGLVVFGRGSDRGHAAALMETVGHTGGVLALGEIEHGVALAVMAACEVFVRATRADGDALSVREALALGRLVVASAAGHRPHGCLLFGVGDAVDLARRMMEASHLAEVGGGPVLPVRDSLERVLDVYRSLALGRPIPSDSAHLAQLSCWTR